MRCFPDFALELCLNTVGVHQEKFDRVLIVEWLDTPASVVDLARLFW
jgi:hypothetical protein